MHRYLELGRWDSSRLGDDPLPSPLHIYIHGGEVGISGEAGRRACVEDVESPRDVGVGGMGGDHLEGMTGEATSGCLGRSV